MDTLTIELTDQRAYKLLKELEALHLIRVIRNPSKISSLRSQIKDRIDQETIDRKLVELRDEWQRDI